ncbi:phasin family protein [Methylocystis echinoides]|uniref:phasin family protein n=1 Tax=Methylocystis echinoides TaxID=29468 RepID=UPI003433DE7C
MTQANFQAPIEIREYVQKSIGQARGAVEAFSRAAKRAVESIESTLPPGVKEANEKAFSYSQANISAAFDLAQKLTQAEDLGECLRLQGEYMKTQSEALQAQAQAYFANLQKSHRNEAG